MRLLWTLPKAAPAILRHMVAYIDLAAMDLSRAHREMSADLVASAVTIICGLFAVFMGCLGVVAYTWDTAYRLAAIGWMGAGFLILAIAAALYRSNAARSKSHPLASVRREWQEDRVILERILSSAHQD